MKKPKKLGAPHKKKSLKTTPVTLRLPNYLNDWLNKNTKNKNKFIKIALLNSDPGLKIAGLKAGEKCSDDSFDQTLEELKK